ncbi:MAG: hypothetical protein WC635_08190 [Bacteriovorax sp.]
MQIALRSREDSDTFIFGDSPGPAWILLPENISIKDFILLIQGSLDQLKTVILLNGYDQSGEIKLTELKTKHYKIEKNKFIFLNFSIRNSLSNCDSHSTILKSFDGIQAYFEKLFENKTQ